jgi:cytochrome c peroxidase
VLFGAPSTSPSPPTASRARWPVTRTLRSGDASVDRFRAGDAEALTPLERQGLQLFAGMARCTFCHSGPTLSDGEFHNTGVSARSGSSDVGRDARSGRESDREAFRTPSFRNVAHTAPYMHDGSLATLEEVVEFYDGGGHPNPNLDPDIRALKLTAEEKLALLAFLRTLSGGVPIHLSGRVSQPVILPALRPVRQDAKACDSEVGVEGER